MNIIERVRCWNRLFIDFGIFDDLVKSHQMRWQSKKLQMQGAQNLRSEAYLKVRRNDEGEAQRRRWIFYEAINMSGP